MNTMQRTLLIGITAVLLIGTAAAAAPSDQVIELYLDRETGQQNITVMGAFLDTGTVPDYPQTDGAYRVEIVDDTGTVQYERTVPVNGHTSVTLPYEARYRHIDIYHDGTQLHRVAVPHRVDPRPPEATADDGTIPWPWIAGGLILFLLTAVLYLSLLPDRDT